MYHEPWQLINYDKNNTPEEACAYIEQNIMVKESFNPERMRSKSQAAPPLPPGNLQSLSGCDFEEVLPCEFIDNARTSARCSDRPLRSYSSRGARRFQSHL